MQHTTRDDRKAADNFVSTSSFIHNIFLKEFQVYRVNTQGLTLVTYGCKQRVVITSY